MAHPYVSQAKASQKARLGRLTGKAGKAHGSSSMYFKTAYPKGAGTQREYTISGGKGKNRPDRMAAGGSVKSKRKPHATTNIIISHAGGRGGTGGGGGAGGRSPGIMPAPVPVPRPVPVPAGGPPGGPPQFAGPPPGGAIRPPMPAGPPVGGPPPVPPGMRPPGMKAGGSVKKAAIGGSIESKGKAYKGYPHSPTTEVDSAVSAHKKGGATYKKGGAVKRQDGGGLPIGGAPGVSTSSGVGVEDDASGYDDGGAVEKRQMGGGMGGGMGAGPATGGGLMGLLGSQAPGRGPQGPQMGPPTISGRNMIPAQPLTVPQPKLAASFLQRPAPGTTTTYKKGGSVKHDDEKEDRQLFGKMLKEKGMKRGGGVSQKQPKPGRPNGGMAAPIYRNLGKGFANGGPIPVSKGGAGGKGRLAKSRLAARVPDKTELGRG